MQGPSTIELYRFFGSSATYDLTPHEVAVSFSAPALTFEPCQISRAAIAVGAENAKSALELKMPPDHALVRHLLLASVLGEITSVVLLAAEWDAGTSSWVISGARWVGRVLGVDVSDEAARIRCEPALASLKRLGLRRLYSRTCSHVLYSQACGATQLSAPATVSGVSGRWVSVSAMPAAVDGALAGGWLETASGARHMIVQQAGTDVELLYPADVQPGDTVLLVAGCDHSTATCATRFNNLDNYGGFPFIPIKNPFATGVF